jgi:transposase
VDRLDQTALNQCYAGVGSRAYRPDLMLKMVLYENLEGRLSPAQWARDIPINDALRWLGQGIRPSRSALYNFRDRIDDAVFALHAGAIRRAMAEGFTTAEHGVLDGTAMRACASRHHLAHEEKLRKRLEELSAAVDRDLAGHPGGARPCWMATTPLGRQEQLQRYRRAETQLAERLARNQERPKDKRLPCNQVRVSRSDPEAPLGRDKEKVYCPLYTVQFLVDADSLLILSFDAFAQATEAGTLPPMLDRTAVVTGRMLDQIDTDAGYGSVLDLQACHARGVQLVAPVQENDFTEQKRTQAQDARLGKDRFQWLPEERT